MTDSDWLAAAKAKFGYENPLIPVKYTKAAWARWYDMALWAPNPEEGDLDREKTKAGLRDLGINTEGL